MKYLCLFVLLILSTTLNAHQFTPTYPVLQPSHVDGVMVARMTLFNRREDVQFYDVSVFDSEWNSIPFATENQPVKINYLETKPINVYIRESDVKRVTYICTQSKLVKQSTTGSLVSSKICSKVKKR